MSATETAPPAPKTLGVGIHKDISFLDYQRIDALNWSTLAPYRKSAKEGHYRELVPEEETEALDFGTAFHTAVLEPDRFAAEYVVMPEWQHVAQSNAGKAERAAWKEANRTKAHLKQDQYDELIGMQHSVRSHPLASAILLNSKGANELTIIWKDPRTGLLCKGRIDRLARVPIGQLDPNAANADDMAIVAADIKTTRSIVPFKFTRDFVDYAYHGQFGFYTDGLHEIRPMETAFYSIAIEKKPPFDLVVYHVGDEALQQGRFLYQRLMDRKIECDKSKRWPGISDRAVPILLPDYAYEGESDGDE